MPNRDLDSTWKYHNGTKHSYLSIRVHPHFLDWENKPLLFKIYPTLEVNRLPKDFRQTGVSALSAIASTGITKGKKLPTLDDIAQLLFFSAGVTRSKKFPGGETFFRAAACTGALYEIELYLVCQDLPDLPAGVYHFGAAEFGLRQLRAGDFRRLLVEATANEPTLAKAPLIIVCTGTYWRNAWKYRSRTYRHFGWDNGTLLANALGVSTSLGFPARLVLGFVDQQVNALLDLDTRKEVAFSLLAVGHNSKRPPNAPVGEPLSLPLVPYSRQEVDYPAMRQMHEASSLLSKEEVTAWRKAKWGKKPAVGAKGALIPLKPVADSELPTDTIEQVIERRGSTRTFARESITFAQLSILLDRATRGIPADFLEPRGTQLNDLYLIVHSVEGLAPGAYFFNRENRGLELLKEGDFRERAGYLGLEQELPADASVDIFFLADLHKIINQFGNRGYRATQLEAGIMGGKLYLGAYAQKLGASGLTFYDDDVVNFFSPHAKGKSAIFLVCCGHSVRR
jgi:SagB-type dehydrogenase family enzyme